VIVIDVAFICQHLLKTQNVKLTVFDPSFDRSSSPRMFSSSSKSLSSSTWGRTYT